VTPALLISTISQYKSNSKRAVEKYLETIHKENVEQAIGIAKTFQVMKKDTQHIPCSDAR